MPMEGRLCQWFFLKLAVPSFLSLPCMILAFTNLGKSTFRKYHKAKEVAASQALNT